MDYAGAARAALANGRPQAPAAHVPLHHLPHLQGGFSLLVDYRAVRPAASKVERADFVLKDLAIPPLEVLLIYVEHATQLLVVTLESEPIYLAALERLRNGVPWGAAGDALVYGCSTLDSITSVRVSNIPRGLSTEFVLAHMQQFGRILRHAVGRDRLFPRAGDAVLHLTMQLDDPELLPQYITVVDSQGALAESLAVHTDAQRRLCSRCGRAGHFAQRCKAGTRSPDAPPSIWSVLLAPPPPPGSQPLHASPPEVPQQGSPPGPSGGRSGPSAGPPAGTSGGLPGPSAGPPAGPPAGTSGGLLGPSGGPPADLPAGPSGGPPGPSGGPPAGPPAGPSGGLLGPSGGPPADLPAGPSGGPPGLSAGPSAGLLSGSLSSGGPVTGEVALVSGDSQSEMWPSLSSGGPVSGERAVLSLLPDSDSSQSESGLSQPISRSRSRSPRLSAAAAGLLLPPFQPVQRGRRNRQDRQRPLLVNRLATPTVLQPSQNIEAVLSPVNDGDGGGE